MLLLDLDEVDEVLEPFWLWSARKPALARFRRSDHVGDPDQPLKETIAELVRTETGREVTGPIRLLTHLSYLGYCFNPLSVFYCFDENEQLIDTVLEVSNTPWGERHCYVLSAESNKSEKFYNYAFEKEFHVSPFLSMDMSYKCRLTPPDEQVFLSLNNYQGDKCIFSSRLALQRREINSANMALTLLQDPFVTLRVITLIHWQALKLWIKRVPYVPHTKNHAV
jgi:DUF1365 family protein